MCQYFRVIKKRQAKRPRLVRYLSIQLNNRTKTTPKYLSSTLFLPASRHTAREIYKVRMCLARSKFVSEHQTQRSYMKGTLHV